MNLQEILAEIIGRGVPLPQDLIFNDTTRIMSWEAGRVTLYIGSAGAAIGFNQNKESARGDYKNFVYVGTLVEALQLVSTSIKIPK